MMILIQTARERGLARLQVSFQWKNPDFLNFLISYEDS